MPSSASIAMFCWCVLKTSRTLRLLNSCGRCDRLSLFFLRHGAAGFHNDARSFLVALQIDRGCRRLGGMESAAPWKSPSHGIQTRTCMLLRLSRFMVFAS